MYSSWIIPGAFCFDSLARACVQTHLYAFECMHVHMRICMNACVCMYVLVRERRHGIGNVSTMNCRDKGK